MADAKEIALSINNTNEQLNIMQGDNVNKIIANNIQLMYGSQSNSMYAPQSVLAQSISYSFSYKYNQDYYSNLPSSVYDYENRIIKPLANLHDGYLMTLHNSQQGIFNTNLAASIVTGISNSIWRAYKGFKYKGGSDTQKVLEKLEEWAEKANFFTEFKKALTYSTMLGTSCVKVDCFDGLPVMTAFRKEYFYVNVSSSNKTKILEAKFVLDQFVNSIPNSEDAIYYVVERRFFNRNYDVLCDCTAMSPMVEYYVCKSGGNVSTSQTYSVDKSRALAWDAIPENVKEHLCDNVWRGYNNPQPLPPEFNGTLGCRLFMYDGFDDTMPGAPYGKSILQNIFSYIVFWELNRSFSVRDQYNGKGVVYIPEALLSGDTAIANTGLDMATVKAIPGLDEIKVIQHEIRAEEWDKAKNSILECIAVNINCSPSTIASFLNRPTGNVTATQVEYEASATNQLVYTQIMNFNNPVNELMSFVAAMLGISGIVKIKYREPGSNTAPMDSQTALEAYRERAITHQELLKTLFPDKEDFEIDKILNESNTEREAWEKKTAFGQVNLNRSDYYGES